MRKKAATAGGAAKLNKKAGAAKKKCVRKKIARVLHEEKRSCDLKKMQSPCRRAAIAKALNISRLACR